MGNPWEGIVDFGVVHALAFPECRAGEGPVVATLRELVRDPTFRVAEIAPPKDPMERAAARAILADAGWRTVYLPILPIILEDLPIASAEVSARIFARQRLMALIEEAIVFGATIAMVQGPRDPGRSARAATTERLVEDLQLLCDFADACAREHRLFLTLENFDREIEKKRLIGPTAEAVALATAVDRQNFGLTIDLSHLPLLGETPDEALSLAASHLVHAHIGNCVVRAPQSPLYGDFHPRFGHPEGEHDIPQVTAFLRALDRVAYWKRTRERLGALPILSIEIRRDVGETSQEVLENGKRVFRAAWQMAMGSL